jgi:hypothetical protein
MPDPDEHLTGLPEVLRSSNRPIVIYQGAPPGDFDSRTSNAVGVLSWLALLTVCLVTIVFCAWQVWNPGYDQSQFSPIYADGRPRGLAKQIEERRLINERADGLVGFLDQLRAEDPGRRSTLSHPLFSDRDGIDDVRRQWDAMCSNIRARIYDRRVGQIDARAAELRRQRSREGDAVERARMDSDLRSLAQQRTDQLDRRRTDSDPALRCVPASEAPVCSDSNNDAWCNPDLRRPGEFVDEVS